VLEIVESGISWPEVIWSCGEVKRLLGRSDVKALPSVNFAHGDLTASEQGPEQHAVGLGAGQLHCVLMRRLNSSWSRSTALVVRIDRHWLWRKRRKVKSRSPASSKLSATALHFSRHLRRKALRLRSTSLAVSA
jgi:hypothetical protein